VTRAELEEIRGVDCTGVLRTLLDRRLIRIVGRRQVLGRPMVYGTTRTFLEHFGLSSLADLPKLKELVPP
jgi:segregation and condensation protein B